MVRDLIARETERETQKKREAETERDREKEIEIERGGGVFEGGRKRQVRRDGEGFVIILFNRLVC